MTGDATAEVCATRERQTVTVSLPRPLAAEVDRVAHLEGRTRSELLREAFRLYVERRRRWDSIVAYAEERACKLGIESEEDVERLLDEFERDQRERGERREQPERRAATGS